MSETEEITTNTFDYDRHVEEITAMIRRSRQELINNFEQYLFSAKMLMQLIAIWHKQGIITDNLYYAGYAFTYPSAVVRLCKDVGYDSIVEGIDTITADYDPSKVHIGITEWPSLRQKDVTITAADPNGILLPIEFKVTVGFSNDSTVCSVEAIKEMKEVTTFKLNCAGTPITGLSETINEYNG